MATSTVEDYVKRIYMLQQRTAAPDGLVPLGQVSSVVGVVPGTATTMVKALAESGLVHYEPRSGVRLTTAGEKLALHVLRRHRLVELFLVNVLGFDWSEVDVEAEQLEHAISDRLLERIDQHLGHPAYDPHGDPIPTAAGTIRPRATTPLAEAVIGLPLTIAHITDQDAHFLGYAAQRGLVPGVCVTIEGVDTLGDSVSLCVGGQTKLTLGRAAAMKIAVQASA
jgi:DtxR family Mn-dependent transcriptional regulator